MNIKDVVKALKEAEKRTSPYDTEAEVVRTDGETVWVRIPGSDDETPVSRTIEAKEGDTVQVRVSGGTAFLVGNATAPPTDDTVAVQAQEVAEGAAEAAERAAQEASEAATIAGNTNQYFWHTEEGTDTGAHITEVPRDEFLADPENGGGNLLARSNGIAVRVGLEELATFGAAVVELGKNSESAIIKFCEGIVNIDVYHRVPNQTSARLMTEGVYDGNTNALNEIILYAQNEYGDDVAIAGIRIVASAANHVEQIILDADEVVAPSSRTFIPQSDTTTWTAPTILNSSCTITNGGYYTEGKRVYIQMRLTLTANLAANAGINIFSGLPVPDTVNAVPLAILANNRGGAGARVTNAGQIQIIANIDHGITAGQAIDMSGCYTIA